MRLKLAISVFIFAICGVVYGDEPILPPDAGVPIIRWQDAAKHLEEEVVVQGPIVAANKTKSICFLNFDKARSFTAIIKKENYKNFSESPEIAYASRLVRIHGYISEYRGKTQIEVSSPSQIRILSENESIPEAAKPVVHEFKGKLTLACFNVLNLFDEYDDPYHSDEGTPGKPRAELEVLAKAIREINADVIALEEVENRGYLSRFARGMLSDMGYSEVVSFDGNDARGIECSVLSRLPVGPVTSHRHLTFPDEKGETIRFQRDLLQVRIEPKGFEAFDLFVVHLKSKRGSDTERVRAAEARQAKKILDGLLKKDPGHVFMICGDFNDTWDSKAMKILRGDGDTGLQCFLTDLPSGAASYNKPPHVSIIDYILCSPAAAKRYVAKSYRVLSGNPSTIGSDHNPVIAEFDLKRAKADAQAAKN